MSRYEKVIEEYYALQPFRYRELMRMELRYTQSYLFMPHVMELELELCQTFNSTEPRLWLRFVGVQEIRFNSRMSPPYVTHLTISSIHERQWEHLNYLVCDEEEDSLRFLCREFTARLANGS